MPEFLEAFAAVADRAATPLLLALEDDAVAFGQIRVTAAIGSEDGCIIRLNYQCGRYRAMDTEDFEFASGIARKAMAELSEAAREWGVTCAAGDVQPLA